MLNKKFYKPITDENRQEFIEGQIFADNNNCRIAEFDEYYQIVEIPPPPPPTIDELKQGLINAVQTYMDTTAQTRGYDSIASACSYGLSTVQKFREEAVACISWRDNVWNYCYEQLALFEGGQRDVPTVEQLIAELPTLEW